MVFSTVIIVGLAKEIPRDRCRGRGRGRGRRPRLLRHRHRLVSGFQLARSPNKVLWRI